jgi:DNA-binding GntR family transcriptional regulator
MVNDEEGARTPGRIKRSPGLVDEIYNVIRADIMSLKIPPDTRISIGSLVRELGVSQTPIREALSMLEGIGLVSKKHNFGYCTAPTLNRRQFDDLFEVRLLIEPFGARRAAERMSDSELEELSAIARNVLSDFSRNMEPGVPRDSYGLFADQDSEFHSRLAAASGNILILDAFTRLHAHMHIFRLGFQSEAASAAFSEHEEIMKALQARDPEQAEHAMRTHLYNSYNRLVKFVRD